MPQEDSMWPSSCSPQAYWRASNIRNLSVDNKSHLTSGCVLFSRLNWIKAVLIGRQMHRLLERGIGMLRILLFNLAWSYCTHRIVSLGPDALSAVHITANFRMIQKLDISPTDSRNRLSLFDGAVESNTSTLCSAPIRQAYMCHVTSWMRTHQIIQMNWIHMIELGRNIQCDVRSVKTPLLWIRHVRLALTIRTSAWMCTVCANSTLAYSGVTIANRVVFGYSMKCDCAAELWLY